MTNLMIKHNLLNTAPLDTANDRYVEIHLSQPFKEKLSKKLRTVPGFTTFQKWSNGTNATRIIDLLNVDHKLSIIGTLSHHDTALTTINGAINASVTTITLTDATKVDNATTTNNLTSYIRIDDELISYTGKSSNDLTGCVRGFGGTTAASHDNGANVFHPGFHYKEILKYMVKAGGVMHIYFPVTFTGTGASTEITEAKSYKFITKESPSPTEETANKGANVDDIEFTYTPQDASFADGLIEVTLSVTVGNDL